MFVDRKTLGQGIFHHNMLSTFQGSPLSIIFVSCKHGLLMFSYAVVKNVSKITTKVIKNVMRC